ncbi:MAG: YafY family transcriptional regulator [Chloroflexi bacterium]|nr:YafY family transcriptional regulator [Chloroflexota bacterium]MCL5273803.1 YafY family transcriptional regulator [Chloroflexota bacterium]
MNRTDRLLAIVLELQRHGKLRAEDLAATFEVNKRTIYRDVEALCESGVPIMSVTGQGYSLVEGYFLPPLSFDIDEATMLLLGADFMQQHFDAQYGRAARSAGAKIEGVLQDRLRKDVRAIKASLRFISSQAASPEVQARLQMLRGAILECRRVRFRYFARFADEAKGKHEWREADPYLLTNVAQVWYTSAFDHKHGEVRVFRLDRMEDLTVSEIAFVRPALDVLKGLQNRGNNQRTIVVKALFSKSVTRWVKESQSFFATHEEETDEGLLVIYTIRREDELLQWLLGWGRNVRVLEPASLRDRLRAEAEAMMKNHTAASY